MTTKEEEDVTANDEKTPNDEKTENKATTSTTKEEDSSCSNISNKNNKIKNEHYELQVQEQYLRHERPSCLGPLPEIAHDDNAASSNNNKKNKKKRPRDKRPPMSEKLCMYLIQGKEECPHGATCKFSHDVKLFLQKKEEDLSNLLGGSSGECFPCPQYTETGFCKFGITCRLGESCHITKDGKNLIDEEKQQLKQQQASTSTTMHASTLNIIDKSILTQLRKKKYPFVCPRQGAESRKKDKKNVDPKIRSLLQEIQPAIGDNLPKRKNIDWNDKVYIAPLTTVGNLPFRRILKELYGADITCGEMAVVGNLLEGRQSEWSLLKRHSSEDVFGIQLASGYPDQLTRISEVLANSESNIQVDFVDINMGCPLDLICNKGAGASLMMHHNRLQPALIGMVNTLNGIPVTLKMRTGWDTSKPLAHSLISKIHSMCSSSTGSSSTVTWEYDDIRCPAAIFVHGRSRLQRYSKEADWNYIANDVATVQTDIPIIGNGDLFSYADYKKHVLDPIDLAANEEKTALSRTAMLARGALIKPWLATEIKEARVWDISATERFDMLRKFCHYGLEQWGSDTQGVQTTRRFLLEWLSFLHRYIPVGLLKEGEEQQQQQSLNQRPPTFMEGRSELETLLLSPHCHDWIQISERLLGKAPEGFQFEPKHNANSYTSTSTGTSSKTTSW